MSVSFDTPITTNDQSIDRVLSAGVPVLLVAAPGNLKRRVQDQLHKLARAEAGRLLVVKIDLSANPAAASRLKLPGGGVLAFRDGQEVSRVEGDPEAYAVQAAADYLMGRGPKPGETASAAADGRPFPVTDGTFEREVLRSPVPVLVDFWAPWCGPCHMIAPVVEKLAAEYAGRLRVAKVNTDENPQWASRYGVQGIPTLFLVKNGQIIDRLVGVQPEPVLRASVERALLLS